MKFDERELAEIRAGNADVIDLFCRRIYEKLFLCINGEEIYQGDDNFQYPPLKEVFLKLLVETLALAHEVRRATSTLIASHSPEEQRVCLNQVDVSSLAISVNCSVVLSFDATADVRIALELTAIGSFAQTHADLAAMLKKADVRSEELAEQVRRSLKASAHESDQVELVALVLASLASSCESLIEASEAVLTAPDTALCPLFCWLFSTTVKLYAHIFDYRYVTNIARLN